MKPTRWTPLVLVLGLLLAGCGGGSGQKVSSTRRNSTDGYLSTMDYGYKRGLKFEDIIPVEARITAVNVAADNGVRAIWLSYEHKGKVKHTPRRGGEGGITQVLELKSKERLVDIEAAGLRGIDKLTVTTNRRVVSFGNPGKPGELKSWLSDSRKARYVGIGITGRADDQLRQISLRVQVRPKQY